MTFIEAISAIVSEPATFVRVSRPNGPSFRADDLGGLYLEKKTLYVGDILDFDDWTVEGLPGEHWPRMEDHPV